jgi:hypothetical protein
MTLKQVESFGRIGTMSRKSQFVCSIDKPKANWKSQFVCSIDKPKANCVERYLVVSLDFVGTDMDDDDDG